MPKPLEVRAITSFGVFRIGNVYEVDIEDQAIMSLLGVGYLEPTSDLEEAEGQDDDAGLDRSPELGVGDSGVPAADGGDDLARRSEAEGVADVADSAGPGSDATFGTSARVRSRKAASRESSRRGSNSGEVGNA
jgi:hypothetical protein